MPPSAQQLPIHEIETELHAALAQHNRLIVEAPTGSGKSTRIPQMLLADSSVTGKIAVLQPRRMAARLLARRVAAERGVPLGTEVGYQVRLEHAIQADTRLRYETEGILLRQLLSDPKLQGMGAIVFDEFHERHLYTDVSLGLILDLQERARPDLKLLVMSATLDASRLETVLRPCQVLRATGRTYPVDIHYEAVAPRPKQQPIWELAADRCAQSVAKDGRRNTLIFMPGAYEIQRTLDALQRRTALRGMSMLPLHGDLPADRQDQAVDPCASEKIVVTTNIAETSLTIDGVMLVIDCGIARKARFDPRRGINALMIEAISRASADQRAGRAGRTAPGTAYRLWTEQDHQRRPAHETPEILCVDLAETILLLHALGIHNPRNFRWMDPPQEAALDQTQRLLQDLGAIDHNDHMTSDGRQMLSFPLHPRQSRMLLAAEYYGCVPTACLLAALSQERGIFSRRQDPAVAALRDRLLGEEPGSDLLRMAAAWRYARDHQFEVDACRQLGIHAGTARQAGRLAEQFIQLAEQAGLDTYEQNPEPDSIKRCILSGFSDQTGRRISGTNRYELVHGRRGNLSKQSVVRGHELIVATEIIEIERRQGEIHVDLSMVTAISSDWLKTMYPQDMVETHDVRYDAVERRVLAERCVCFRDLVLERKRCKTPPADEAARILTAEVLADRLTLKHWNEKTEQWIQRVNTLAQAWPELEIPPIHDAERAMLIEQICYGCVSAKQVKLKPVDTVLRTWLTTMQQDLLARYAPERLTLENGRHVRIHYERTGAPCIKARIQELFGVTRPLSLADGRIRLHLQILAPNHRPVQITDDLTSFWQDHYPALKQQLQKRYPKHEWR